MNTDISPLEFYYYSALVFIIYYHLAIPLLCAAFAGGYGAGLAIAHWRHRRRRKDDRRDLRLAKFLATTPAPKKTTRS